MEIIGRARERRILTRCENSEKPEFVAIYGRRRIGKTFLITQHFNNRFTFSATGVSDGSAKVQLRVFHDSLKRHFQSEMPVPSDWLHAFALLEEQLEQDITIGKKILFLDELPWFDTPKSGFLSALEHFWNAFASRRKEILLIVCGSAASWITRKLINSYGGFHNRVTETIVVEPFPISDCEKFYQSRGIAMNRHQIAEAYMIFGGVPFYMDAMDKIYGLNQNIDMLLFEENAKLKGEFDRLYHSLFKNAANHIKIAEILAKNNAGMTRQELTKSSGIPDGGGLTKVLDEMRVCGLIDSSLDYYKKRNGEYYKLVDFFSLFHFKFIKTQKKHEQRFWTNFLSYPAHRAWCGYAFERLCIAHIDQVKQKLGISGVISEVFAFRSALRKGGCQIDIVIDRRDETINLCECKFTTTLYTLTKGDADDFERKKAVFLDETGTKKSIHLTMIASNGLAQNAYRNEIQSEITLDDLFYSAN